MAASSPEGDSLVWKTTPKEPFPTILHWVYCISLVSPVRPSWTFSRITSARVVSTGRGTASERGGKGSSTYLPFSGSKRPTAGSVTWRRVGLCARGEGDRSKVLVTAVTEWGRRAKVGVGLLMKRRESVSSEV